MSLLNIVAHFILQCDLLCTPTPMQCNSDHVSPSPNKKHKEVPKLSITPDPQSSGCTISFHKSFKFFQSVSQQIQIFCLIKMYLLTKYHLVCCFTSIFYTKRKVYCNFQSCMHCRKYESNVCFIKNRTKLSSVLLHYENRFTKLM